MPFFETEIRYLGGLLASYHLASISPYDEVLETASILRTKAEELGEATLPAFNTESGLPAASVDTSGYARHDLLYPDTIYIDGLSQRRIATSRKATNHSRRNRVESGGI